MIKSITLQKAFLAIIIIAGMACLVCSMTGCSSTKKLKTSEYNKKDSATINNTGSSSAQKSDSAIDNIELDGTHHGVTVIFDNSQDCDDNIPPGNDYEAGNFINNDSTAKVKSHPAKTYVYDFDTKKIISSKPIGRIYFDDDSSHGIANHVKVKKQDSTTTVTSTNTHVKSTTEIKAKDVIKKRGIPFWIWILLVLIVAGIVYKKRGWIIENVLRKIT